MKNGIRNSRRRKGIQFGVLCFWFNCCGLLFADSINSDEYFVERLELERGVSAEITSIVQDGNGFLWFGTLDGLVRYDGYQEEIYEYKYGDKSSLSYNMITCLYLDRQKRLWVGTYNGLNLFDTRTQNFEHFFPGSGRADNVLGFSIFQILEDKEGNVWAITSEGVFQVERRSKVFKAIPLNRPIFEGKPTHNYKLTLDQAGGLWLTAYGKLLKYNTQKQRFDRVSAVWKSSKSRERIKLFKSKSELMWAVANGELFRFSPETATFSPSSLPLLPFPNASSFKILLVYEDRAKNVWLGVDNQGLLLWSSTQRRWFWFQHHPNKFNTLSQNGIEAIFEDQTGVLWVGTSQGLNKIQRNLHNFHFFGHNSWDKSSLTKGTVTDICKDREGGLWIATLKGLDYKPMGAKGFKHFKVDREDPGALFDEMVYSLAEDSKGRIWVGTQGALHLFNRETDRFKRYLADPGRPETLAFGLCHKIAEDAAGFLWLGQMNFAQKNIYRFDPEREELSGFHSDPDDETTISSPAAFSFFLDSKQRFWVATNKGLNVFDQETQSFRRFKADAENLTSISNNLVIAFYEDAVGALWIGTGSGLNRMNQKAGTFEVFNKQHNLPANTIYSIAGDRSGHLWLSHRKGITKYDPESRTAVNYGYGASTRNKQNWNTSFIDKEGVVYLGGYSGVTTFNPNQFKVRSGTPPVQVVGIHSETMISELPWEVQKIRLDYSKSSIKFYTMVPDHANPEKNLFTYKLEGAQEQWSTPSPVPYVYLHGLDPGAYRLRLKGANSDGVWNDTEARIDLIIEPPLWKTTEAYLFYALFFPLLLLTGHRARVKHLKIRERELEAVVAERTGKLREEKEKTEKQAQKLLELDQLKTQFFANISHEFRTPLTLIIGPLEAMLSGIKFTKEQLKEQNEVMLRNGRRLLRLINQLLDVSKLEAGKIKLLAGKGNFIQFLKTITFAFHSLAEQRKIQLQVISDNPSLELWFDPEKMEKVMFNLLSNAFKFVPDGGSIRVRVIETSPNSILVRVEDNGAGIPEKSLPYIFDRFRQADGSMTRCQEGTGIGLTLAKELVVLHHGSIEIASKEGKGTEVLITLPRGSKHLQEGELNRGELKADQLYAQSLVDLELAGLRRSKTPELEQTGRGLGETVLIVDDHEDIRDYICNAFSSSYRILEAEDGEQGLEMARKFRPHLIVSDVMMPKLDGYGLCQEIKKDSKLSHTPIILLTAKASDDMKVEGLAIGADDYLSKPFNVKELQVRVRNLLQMRGQQHEMQKSLEMACKAQMSMLPQSLPDMEGLEIATFCHPAKEVGGDYYDFIRLDKDRLGVVIGDVSGKGMPAALYMTMTKGLLLASTHDGKSPKQTLIELNAQFQRASAANIFLSFIYGVIDLKKREMTFASAGHNPMIHYSAKKRCAQFLKAGGMAIGLDEGKLFKKVIAEHQLTLEKNDYLVLYTDGITEGVNRQNDVFGEQRLLDIVEQKSENGASALAETLQSEYQNFIGEMEPFDDMTAVILNLC